MLRNQETGATFNPDEIGWIDFEGVGRTDIKNGAYRYVCESDAVILAYAIGDGDKHTIAVPDFPRTLHWSDIPDVVKRHHERVKRGEAVWAAWNAGFDKAVWNYSCIDFPMLEPHHIIDVMAQAVASGLPPDLAMAAKQAGAERKDSSGKALIKLFCLPASTATPQTHPTEWQQFISYAGDDIIAMRSVFKRTRQLPYAEWEQYWAGEVINERGIHIDLPMVEHAAKLADEDKRRSKRELTELTEGQVTTVDQVKRMTEWLLDRLPPSGRDILVKRAEEKDDETGEITRPAKYQLTRKQVQRLIVLLQSQPLTNTSAITLRLLQIRLYGGSKTPQKFGRMLTQHVDGVLMGQYAFNGAAQTGRFSSKGVQVHNLARDALEHEADLLDLLLMRCLYERLAEYGTDDPVARKLALLIRPSLVPRDDNHVFTWSDWSQIEARILPWLCGDDPRAEARLQIFRDVDADPTLPDLYTRSAAEISHVDIEQVTKPIRQRGKVAELALGFMGGVAALQNMAANYGMFLSDEEAREIVTAWREANQWAVDFSKALWEAMRGAHRFPGDYVTAGRVGFVFLPNYLGGSLLMRLPSGRCLTYRRLKWEYIDILDDDDQPTGETKLELTCHRGYGRIKLWPGLFVENAVQGTAACFLRGTLVRLEIPQLRWMPVRLHTHDEILAEVEKQRAQEAAARLRIEMQRGFDWSEGLPLMSEETIAYHYTKHEASFGL